MTTSSLTGALKLYMNNTYLFGCSGKVKDCSGKLIHVTVITAINSDDKGTYLKLSDTIFHPQGGGQPCDLGTIECGATKLVEGVKLKEKSLKVLDVRKEIFGGQVDNFDVKHYVAPEDAATVKVGECVNMAINPMRRILNARLHTCGHLIAALVERQFPFLKATGGHHVPQQANVQFGFIDEATAKTNTEKTKKEVNDYLSNQLPAEIAAKKPIAILKTPEGRKIQIEGYPAVGCGGTHLQSTSEIGEASISGVSMKKGELKVSYKVLGEEAEKSTEGKTA